MFDNYIIEGKLIIYHKRNMKATKESKEKWIKDVFIKVKKVK